MSEEETCGEAMKRITKQLTKGEGITDKDGRLLEIYIALIVKELENPGCLEDLLERKNWEQRMEKMFNS